MPAHPRVCAAIGPEARECAARATASAGWSGSRTFARTRDRTARLGLECGAEGRLEDGQDRNKLVRKWAVFCLVRKTRVHCKACGRRGGSVAHLEFEAGAVRLRYAEEVGQLAHDAVDILNVVFGACPELDAVDFRAETDDSAADIVTLFELLANERHCEPLPAPLLAPPRRSPNRPAPGTSYQRRSWACRALLPWCRDRSSV